VDEGWFHDIFSYSSGKALDEELLGFQVANSIPSFPGQLFKLRNVLVDFRPLHA
jgi:hypothetical protein